VEDGGVEAGEARDEAAEHEPEQPANPDSAVQSAGTHRAGPAAYGPAADGPN
jgi:hypothetical protein